MNIGTYATTIQAKVMREREAIEDAYDNYADSTLFWSFIDLRHSSNFRIVRGAKAGYVRAETFFSLVRAVIAPCSDVTLLKEIGDEVMLCCSSFRPLFESVLLIDQAASQLGGVFGSDHYPFGIKAAIGFGVAKRLSAAKRTGEDFVGTAIDELARMTSEHSSSNIKISKAAFDPSEAVLNEYASVVKVGASKPVTGGKAATHLRGIFYHDVMVNRAELEEFGIHFSPWRKSLLEGARRHT